MTRRQPGAGARRLPGSRKSGVRPPGDSPSYGASASAVPVAPAGPGTPGAAPVNGTGEPEAPAGPPGGAEVPGPELRGGADAPGTVPGRPEVAGGAAPGRAAPWGGAGVTGPEPRGGAVGCAGKRGGGGLARP